MVWNWISLASMIKSFNFGTILRLQVMGAHFDEDGEVFQIENMGQMPKTSAHV